MHNTDAHRTGTAAVILFSAAARLIAATTGLDCDCALEGAYLKPNTPAIPSVGANGKSPGGKFAAKTTRNLTGYELRVTRNADGHVMIQVQVSLNSRFGFSPDDSGFFYDSIGEQASSAGFEQLALYNTVGASAPIRPVWSRDRVATVSSFGFSPHGRFLVSFTVNGANSGILELIDVSTGKLKLSRALQFYDAPITNFQVAGWGFGPDSIDRSFIYSHAIDARSVSLNLINLGTGLQVFSRTINTLASWRFSPCGDALGTVEINNHGTEVSLVRTVNGTNEGTRTLSSLDISLSVTASFHVATSSGQTTVLAPNTALEACPPDLRNTVWVDFAFKGDHTGTFDNPFDSLTAAVNASEGEVIIKAGLTDETPRLEKPTTITAYGGTATIGRRE